MPPFTLAFSFFNDRLVIRLVEVNFVTASMTIHIKNRIEKFNRLVNS